MKLARTLASFVLGGAVLLAASAVQARPLYFENVVNIYGILPGDDIYACGICHQRWEGTGGRNPYGFAVEQQLYIGKSIIDAIQDIDAEDTDGDGFTNGDELGTWGTLPGYSCSNFDLVINPPSNFQSLITPGVPSCLEPLDIRITPSSLSFVTEVGNTAVVTVQLQNNGDQFPVTVSAITLLGAPVGMSLTPPALPLVIPVGQTATVDVTFQPPGSGIANATLRVESDDPDEPIINLPVSALSFVQPLAPASQRSACLKTLEKETERLTKTSLREWGRCFLDEQRGVACNAAARDLRIGKAQAKLRSVVGGAKDKNCAGQGLSASLLGLGTTCGAPCGSITLSSITRLADCVVCRQTAATNAMLDAAIGTTPPDLPAMVLAPNPHRCSLQLVTGIDKGIRAVQKELAKCEAAAILAGTDPDCSAELASTLTREADKVNERVARCSDTTGLEGCLFGPGADPTCLGTTAVTLGTGLVQTVFGDD